jgi:hypothetical protein
VTRHQLVTQIVGPVQVPALRFPLGTITAEAFEVVLVLPRLTLSNEALEDVFGPQQLRFSCSRSGFRVPVGCREFLSLAETNPREERLAYSRHREGPRHDFRLSTTSTNHSTPAKS